MAERMALVDAEGRVVNVVLAASGWQHPEFQVVPDPEGSAEIGGIWTGSEFSPPPPPTTTPEVPRRITRRQARLALLQAGLLDAVEQIMSDPETPRAVRITYEDATEWWRDDPMIAQFASALNISEEQVDDLFSLAATL